MLDVALIKVMAGKGGDGSVHFRREKYVPKGGPDGGDGGDGGSMFLRGNANLRTLDYFAGRERFEAERGEAGRKRKQHGKNGNDRTIEVPLGTVVWGMRRGEGENEEPSRQEMLGWLRLKRKGEKVPLVSVGEVTELGKEFLVARGGKGGRGNDRFKSSVNTTPRTAEKGGEGEKGWLVLELKLLADVGLIGLPNAGKSTLLSVLTAARPKIADYEFTTLEPNLGVMQSEIAKQGNSQQEWVIADIPGLVEGASHGRGLGDEFLRHVERCRVLVHVMGLKVNSKFEIRSTKQSANSNDQNIKQIAEQLWGDYETVRKELGEYHPDLLEKPEIVVVNKMDLVGNNEKEVRSNEIRKYFRKKGLEEVVFVSGVTGEGLEELKNAVVELGV